MLDGESDNGGVHNASVNVRSNGNGEFRRWISPGHDQAILPSVVWFQCSSLQDVLRRCVLLGRGVRLERVDQVVARRRWIAPEQLQGFAGWELDDGLLGAVGDRV